MTLPAKLTMFNKPASDRRDSILNHASKKQQLKGLLAMTVTIEAVELTWKRSQNYLFAKVTESDAEAAWDAAPERFDLV